jgi:hypothetical protein
MSFEEAIQNWVAIDNEIKERTVELRNLRSERSQHQENILDHVTTNNMAHKTVQISDGNLRFQNCKVTAPLTFKFITQCLNDCISDEGQVKQLVNYIKQRRAVKYVPEVKRSYK